MLWLVTANYKLVCDVCFTMVHLGVRVTETTKQELQELVDEHDQFINESDAVRYAVRRMLESRGSE